MNQKIKEFLLMFSVQIINYCLITINYRAIAHANYVMTGISDFIFASLNFFIIKKIAKSDDTIHQWLGYSLGGVVGALLGIYVSKFIL
jgi:hypothetical protein